MKQALRVEVKTVFRGKPAKVSGFYWPGYRGGYLEAPEHEFVEDIVVVDEAGKQLDISNEEESRLASYIIEGIHAD